jgi:hypothetical protein
MKTTAITVDDLARAIAYRWRSERSDGSMSVEQYAEGIVLGRDAHVRWQDRMFATERMPALDLAAIGAAVVRERNRRVSR